MSNFIQIPFTITDLNTKSKNLETYCYFLIRSQIKSDNLEASITEKELSTKLGISEVQVKRYIKDLKPFFKDITKKQGVSKYPYNVYHFSYLTEYVMILPSLIEAEISADLKGLLIRMKLYCEKGTNHLNYNSLTEFSKKMGMSTKTISPMLKELQAKKMIIIRNNQIILSCKFFPLSYNECKFDADKLKNHIFMTIYKFCFDKGVKLPLRDTKALGKIAAKYVICDDSLLNDLNKRIKSLPKDVSLDYFVEVLCDINKEENGETKHIFVI